MNLSIFQNLYEFFQFFFTFSKIQFLKNEAITVQLCIKSLKKFLCAIWNLTTKTCLKFATLRSLFKIFKKYSIVFVNMVDFFLIFVILREALKFWSHQTFGRECIRKASLNSSGKYNKVHLSYRNKTYINLSGSLYPTCNLHFFQSPYLYIFDFSKLTI